MKYLVTGAAGFLGRHLVSRLLEIERNLVVATDCVDLDISHKRLEFIRADIHGGLPKIDADVLIHLVGSPGVWYSEKNREEDYKINVISVGSVFKALDKTVLKKAVLSSTWQVYGDNEKREDSQPAPKNAYGRHKYQAELMMKELCREYGASYSILRMSWIYGPGMKKNPIIDIYRGEVFIDINSQLDFVYVDDVCDAFIMASESEGWNNRVVNISSGKAVSLGYINNVFKNKGLNRGLKVISSQLKQVVIDNKLAKTLGWSPKTSIEEGLTRTYESFSG